MFYFDVNQNNKEFSPPTPVPYSVLSFQTESSRRGDSPLAKVKSNYKKQQPSTQAFYTGDKRQPVRIVFSYNLSSLHSHHAPDDIDIYFSQVGVVFKDYPMSKSVRKEVVPASIPHGEEPTSTKEVCLCVSSCINQLMMKID